MANNRKRRNVNQKPEAADTRAVVNEEVEVKEEKPAKTAKTAKLPGPLTASSAKNSAGKTDRICSCCWASSQCLLSSES